MGRGISSISNKKNANRPSSYPHFREVLQHDGIEFPITLKSITKFEDLNKLNINVYTLEQVGRKKNEVVPVRLTTREYDKTIHLLMLYSKETDCDDEEMDVDKSYVNQIRAMESLYVDKRSTTSYA